MEKTTIVITPLRDNLGGIDPNGFRVFVRSWILGTIKITDGELTSYSNILSLFDLSGIRDIPSAKKAIKQQWESLNIVEQIEKLYNTESSYLKMISRNLNKWR